MVRNSFTGYLKDSVATGKVYKTFKHYMLGDGSKVLMLGSSRDGKSALVSSVTKEVPYSDIIAEWQDEPAEVIGENVRVIPIDAAPDELFERMDETRSKPYDAPRSNYHRIIKGVEVDIYDILVAWGVTCPARQHAIKKLLMAGERGAKGVAQYLDEAIQATERAKELVV